MTDWSGVIETARDPLLGVLALFAAGAVASHLLFKRHPLARAIVRVAFLVLLTIALLLNDVVPYRPLELTGTPVRDAVHAILKIAWWLWAAWFLVAFLRAAVVIEQRPREGKLLQDLLAGLIYLAAILAIIAYVLNLPVQGLLATSGVIAIILGLALQSTLSDVFSGIVLDFSRPYRPGDWINLDGGTTGRVIEMNWRATHVLTARRDLAIVPNSVIAKSKIVNVSSPSGIHGTTLSIQIDSQTSPSIGSEILERAVLNCRRIVAEPAATVVVKAINAVNADYEITFFVAELAAAPIAQNELFDLIFRHLAVSGVHLASPPEPPAAVSRVADISMTPPERLLELVAIFAPLSIAERAAIAAKLQPHSHEQGDRLIERGAVLQSLFIVASGVLSFTRDDPDGESELIRLGPGDHFGEIGLLTGDASTGKLTALTPVIVYELTKEDLVPLLEARPEVSNHLCRVLAKRQAMGRIAAATGLNDTMPAHRLTNWFSDRLHRLYETATGQ